VRFVNRWALTGALLFFALGVSWGVLSARGLPFTSKGQKTPLTVICPKAWLPPAVAEEISHNLKTKIVQLDFQSWSEFVRLIANTQGEADVICFHSFLAKDLIQSKFLERAQFQSLDSFRYVSVDFLKLPFDPEFDFSVPLFWGVNGFVVRDNNLTTWKNAWPALGQKMSLLFPDLELLWRMNISGLELTEEDAGDASRKLQSFVQSFSHSLSGLSANRPELSDDDLKKFQIIQLSSGPAALFLKSHPDWKYWLPTDGVSLWFGMAGIGSKSKMKPLARRFVDELMDPSQALTLHRMLGHGVVQAALDNNDQILPMQKARYLREVPLDRVRFPNLMLEILPHWEHLVSEARRL
jgi:spermidine/putrescine transport system substrate-binding protein